jgi:hypothetical protein
MSKQINSKKGIELNQAFGAVLTLVLVAVLVIVAIVIFVNLSSSFAGTSSVTVTNESLTPTAQVSNASVSQFGGFSVTAARNSSGVLMSSGNYTTSADGTITNTTALTGDSATPWQVDYTYTWASTAGTASDNMTSEFGNYTSLIGLVGTIIFLGLVIGVLVASFALSNRRV